MPSKTRITKETHIQASLELTKGDIFIQTPIPFFNHMLEAFAYYAKIGLTLKAEGDLDVDDHHIVEDCGLVIGQLLREAVDIKKTYHRFGSSYIPMDEALSRVVIDISNRPYLVFQATFKNEKIGLLTLQNVKEFFKSLVAEAKITLHMDTFYGDNDHHKVESLFKAFGKALHIAIQDEINVVSTKGVL